MKNLVKIKFSLIIGLVFMQLAFSNEVKAASATWVGGTSTDWGTASNWNPTTVPNNNTYDVTIPTGCTRYPTVGSTSYTIGTLVAMGDGASISGTRTITISNAATCTTIGTATISCQLSISAATIFTETSSSDQLTISGIIKGSAAITKSGAGKLIFSGLDTYTGSTTINAGTLVLNTVTSYASSTTTVNSPGILELTSTNTGFDNWHLNTILAGNGTINKTGIGLIQTFTNAHTFSGTFNIQAGTFGTSLTTSKWSGITADFNISASALLDARGQAIYVGSLNGLGNVGSTYGDPATVYTGAGNKSGSFSGNIQGNATCPIYDTSNPNNGVLNLVKIGTGTQTLSGANIYTGTTTISAGTLIVGADVAVSTNGPLGNSAAAVILGDANTTVNNSSPQIVLNGAYTFARPITITDNATSGWYWVGANTDNNATYSGLITFSQPFSFWQAATSGSNKLTISGGVTGGKAGINQLFFDSPGAISVTSTAISDGLGKTDIVKNNTNTTILSVANTYTGVTYITGGSLKAGVATSAFGSNSWVCMYNNSGATLDITGYDNTIGSLSNGGTTGGNVILGAATLTVGGDNTSTTYSGIISGTGSIVKTGSGTLTLLGSNSYTGSTSINTGTLVLNNVTTYGSSTTTVNSPGILELTSTNTAVNNWRLNTILAGNGTINKTGIGRIQTSTNVHTFSGTFNILAGTFGTADRASVWTGITADFNISAGALLDANGQAITVGSLNGPGNVSSNYTYYPATVITGAGNKSGSFSGIISDSLRLMVKGGTNSLSLAKTGTGTQTFTGSNTYTGTTTITSGEIRLNPTASTSTMASKVILNGGNLSTVGIATGTTITSSSTLSLAVSSNINLGSNTHTLSFANSNAIGWPGTTLTINGWTGNVGISGTAGKLYVGNNNSGLVVPGQLAKINFTGYSPGAKILSTGEIVPITPVAFWFKADGTIPYNGTSWNDETTNTNNGQYLGTGTGTATFADNTINFNPSLTFTTMCRQIQITNSSIVQSFVIVNRPTTTTGNAGLVGATADKGIRLGGAYDWIGGNNSGNWVYNADGGGTSLINGVTGKSFTNWHIVNQTGVAALTSQYYLGGYYSGRPYSGNIAEIMAFSGAVANPNALESYLALKYGITLGHDYIAGLGGATVFPISGYGNDIAGLGNDATYGLNQKVSTSINTITTGTGSQVIIATTNNFTLSNLDASRTSLTNGQYLIWGHNGGTTATWNAAGSPSSDLIVNRTWKIQNTNSVGPVYFQIDLTGYPALQVITCTYGLMISNSTNFNSGTSLYKLTKIGSGNLYVASGVSFPTGTSYFTICELNIPTTATGIVTNASCPLVSDGAITLTAPSDYAVQLNHATNDYIDLGSSLLNNLTAFTLEGWIKYKASDITTGRIGLFGQNDAVEFGIIDSNNINCWTWFGEVYVPITAMAGDNTWHHIAAVGNTTSISIYLDGVLKGSSPVDITTFVTSPDHACIGQVFDPVGTSNQTFPGQIRRVGMWSRTLSASEIATLAASYAHVYTGSETGLIAGYNFSEGSGTTLSPLPAATTGTFVNSPNWVDLLSYSWSNGKTTRNNTGIGVGNHTVTASNTSMTATGTFSIASNNTCATYWVGGTNSTWTNTLNWSAQYVPLSGANVEFANGTNYGTAAQRELDLDTDRTIGNLVNTSSQRLLIPPGKSLSVNGTITTDGNPDKIYIQSSSTLPNGSLIFNNAEGSPVSATVEMYSVANYSGPTSNTTTRKWQYFGIPLRNVTAHPTFDGSVVRQMYENVVGTTGRWVALNNSSVLTPFTGYEIVQPTATTFTFQGQLVNSNYNSGKLSYTSTATNKGEHLIANPYTAAIDIKKIAFGSSNPLVMENTVYLFNTGSLSDWTNNGSGGTSSSNTTTPGQYTSVPQNNAGDAGIPAQVPSMQAFMVVVKKDDPTATVSFPYSSVGTVVKNTDKQRVSKKTQTSTSDKIYTIFDVKGTSYTDKLWIFTEPTCSHSFDNGWDGPKSIGTALAPQIYAMESDGNYQINTVDDINNTEIGFQKGGDVNYTLTVTHQNLAMKYGELYLMDLLQNKTIDITQSGTQYQFESIDGDATKRFKIVTSLGVTTGTPKIDQEELKVFSSGKTIFIRNYMDNSGDLILYDVAGRALQRLRYTPYGLSTFNTNLKAGIYILKGLSATKELTTNLILP
jgi:autotransporter-associated beta strand protein